MNKVYNDLPENKVLNYANLMEIGDEQIYSFG